MATVSAYEMDVLRSLGYGPAVVEALSQERALQILQDGGPDISANRASQQTLEMATTSDVALDTFLTGVESDVVGIAQGTREALSNVGETLKQAPIILIGLVALAIVVFAKK